MYARKKFPGKISQRFPQAAERDDITPRAYTAVFDVRTASRVSDSKRVKSEVGASFTVGNGKNTTRVNFCPRALM